MSQTPMGPGWWQASDGRWYPPQARSPMPPPLPPPPPGYPPAGPPAAQPPSPKRRRWVLPVVLGVVFCLVSAASFGTVVWLQRDDADAGPRYPGAPVALEALDAEGLHPFTGAAAVETTGLSNDAVGRAREVSRELPVDDATGARRASGNEPGLYGGTQDAKACDSFALIEFLEDNPDKAAAWAGVFDIPVDAVPGYVQSLTPVLLTTDTWVTNHGFENGRATPFQSVLQAGSAVLIDDRGVPRVRCACGNPLLEPRTTDFTLHATEGEAWDDYEPTAVRLVAPAEEVLEEVALIDTGTGEDFSRGLGPGQTGKVQVTLRWTGESDLDLHVIDAAGEEIYFDHKVSGSGGALDVDTIPNCDGTDLGPHTENVFWETEAPPGDYTVFVRSYSSCSVDTYNLQVFVGGSSVVRDSGALAADEDSPVQAFKVFPPEG